MHVLSQFSEGVLPVGAVLRRVNDPNRATARPGTRGDFPLDFSRGFSLVFSVCLAVVVVMVVMPAADSFADAVKVEVVKTHQGNGWTLVRDGKPYEVKGAGGDGDKALLAERGGNSARTWGVGDDTLGRLDDAHKHGLTVAVGIWLGHERHGFSYDDPKQVREQFEAARDAVMKFKDHPAVLVWGVGNEMEEYAATTKPKIWKAVNDIAKMIKELDPNHPTMTVVAEIGGDRVASIHEQCPDIDIVGINSYGGVTSIPARYKEAGGTKPYLITEFGPPGTWESGTNGWGVPEELTSTAKGAFYTNGYRAIHGDPMSLGSYAFTWGHKQESTATWFGMFTPYGLRTEAIDAMTSCWTGKAPRDRVPEIESFKITTAASVEKGATVEAVLEARDPEGEPITVNWVLYQEMEEFSTYGDFRPTPPTFPEAIVKSSNGSVTLKMPDRAGNYRVFAYVDDGSGGGAIANAPLRVKGEKDVSRGASVNLPFVVYGDNATGTPFIPSGYMGEHAAIAMDDKNATDPHTGATSLKVSYNKSDGWGGVVWQSPANDWGDRPGGFDLSKAKVLSFWARGERGGETVKFGLGLIGPDKPHYDTHHTSREITLTQAWTRYEFDVDGKDTRCIKSGFYWTVGGPGLPVIFYLDDVRYE